VVRRGALLLLAAACGAHARPTPSPSAKAASDPELRLTIRHDEAASLEQPVEPILEGDGEDARLRVLDVPSQLDGASIEIHGQELTDVALTGGAGRVEPLLQSAVGTAVTVITDQGEAKGILVDVDPHRLLISSTYLRQIARDDVRGVRLANDHGTRTDLVARLAEPVVSPAPAKLVARVAGLTWSAQHELVLDEARHELELGAWASIENANGTTFRDARVTLAEGEHLYPVADKVTLPAGATVRVRLAPAARLPSVRRLLFDPVGPDLVWHGENVRFEPGYAVAGTGTTVDELIEAEALASLPGGPARVLAQARDGALAPLATTTLEPTARGGRVRVRLGQVQGVTGSRRQIEFVQEETRMVEEIELSVKNDSAVARDLVVLDRMARGDTWLIAWASVEARKEDGRTIRFELRVPPHATERLRYRVVYTWKGADSEEAP
jgi:hypothetical protein